MRSVSTGTRPARASRREPRHRWTSVAQFECPILGLMGGADQSVPREEIEKYEAALQAADHPHEICTYDGAPHSFFDRGFEEYSDESDGRVGSGTSLHRAVLGDGDQLVHGQRRAVAERTYDAVQRLAEPTRSLGAATRLRGNTSSRAVGTASGSPITSCQIRRTTAVRPVRRWDGAGGLGSADSPRDDGHRQHLPAPGGGWRRWRRRLTSSVAGGWCSVSALPGRRTSTRPTVSPSTPWAAGCAASRRPCRYCAGCWTMSAPISTGSSTS